MDFLRRVFDALLACCREDDSRSEPTERSALLQQNNRNNNLQIIRRISENHIDDEYPSSLPTREKDEQSALNRIVQETNS